MGKNNRSTQVKENLTKYLEAINANLKENEQLSQQYVSFVSALDTLNEQTDALYTRDMDGKYPPFKKEDHQALLNNYNQALLEYKNLEKVMDNTNTQELNRLIADVKELLAKDVESLSNIAPTNSKSLAECVDDARTLRVNVAGKSFSKVGAASSSRSAMTVIKDGKEIKGFFTEEKKYRTNYNGPLIDETIEQFLELYPGAEKLAGYIKQAISEGNIEPYDICDAIETYSNAELKTNQIELLVQNFTEMDPIKGVLSELAVMRAQYGEALNVKEGETISGRNVAMSNMANLFGVSSIIANSEKMELSDENGNITKGVFMANAQGIDYDKIMPENINNWNEKSGDNPQLLKQVADLQMLDFICGNVDRHQNNFFYQFNEDGSQLIGIQGIDNDFSFGNSTMSDDETRSGGPVEVTLNNITVISQSFSESLFALDESMIKLSLRGSGLDADECQATVDRINRVKNKIIDKKIEVISDEKWKQLDLKTLANGKERNSLFGIVNTQIEKLPDTAVRNQKKAEKKAMEASYSGKKAFKFEEVEQLTGIDKVSFERDVKACNEFASKMDASQKKIFGKSSEEFTKLNEAVKSYEELVKTLPLEPTHNDYLKIQAKLESIKELSNQYIELKTGKNLTTNGQERFDLAKDINSYSNKRLVEVKEAVQRKDEIEVEEMNAVLKAQATKTFNLSEEMNQDIEKIKNDPGCIKETFEKYANKYKDDAEKYFDQLASGSLSQKEQEVALKKVIDACSKGMYFNAAALSSDKITQDIAISLLNEENLNNRLEDIVPVMSKQMSTMTIDELGKEIHSEKLNTQYARQIRDSLNEYVTEKKLEQENKHIENKSPEKQIDSKENVAVL